jgi:hypothetical protein
MTQIQWQYLESIVSTMTSEDKHRLVVMLNAPQHDGAQINGDSWIGCMANEGDLLDAVMKGVYEARENHPLRSTD